jgi:hypothetical protein
MNHAATMHAETIPASNKKLFWLAVTMDPVLLFFHPFACHFSSCFLPDPLKTPVKQGENEPKHLEVFC